MGGGHAGWENIHHVHGSEQAKQSEGDLTEDVCTQSVLPNRFSARLTPLYYFFFLFVKK